MEIADYRPPFPLFNRHLETIYPALFRRVETPPLQRERLVTDDHDFLDLDWLKQKSDRLVIISHGLEGSSRRAYALGMAKAFYDKGFDTLTWNYRGCSDEMNLQLRFYHSGATDDLHRVVKHALSLSYQRIILVGFSLGGNLTLKYAGEQGRDILSQVKAVVTFSVPLDLDGSCAQISQPSNFLYSLRFLRSLKKKIVSKSRIMKGIDVKDIDKINDLRAFDDRYTAPLHGFSSASSYYRNCSALYFLKTIAIPTLVVNARNDPFLSAECFPAEVQNTNITFEYPAHGGHVGFALFSQNGLYWSEARALRFIDSIAL